MEVNLDDLFRRGRRPAPLDVSFDRELRESDLEALQLEPVEYQPPTVAKMRERHHALARLIATGMKDADACAVVGYSTQTLIYLRRNPAFIDLVEMYRANVDIEFAEIASRLSGLTKDALTILQERMEDAPEEIKTRDIIEIAKIGADRTGHGPTSTQNVVNISLGERLARARERAAAAMIDVTPTDVTPNDD